MPTDMIDSGTEAGLWRLASLKWWGKVLAVLFGGVSALAALIGILSYFVEARVERAKILDTLESIERIVEENKAGIAENKAAILMNTAEIKAIRTTVEANSADIKANSVGIAENRASIALVLKNMEKNRNLLVLLRRDIASLKQTQEELGRQQRLLLARHLEFSGKFDEFEARLAALAKTRARDAAETRSAAARMGDVEALVVDLDGRVKRLEDLILVSEDGAAAPSGE